MINNIHPLLISDFYKIFHYEQYPKNTTLVFSNFTPRRSLVEGIDHSVFFGSSILLYNFEFLFTGFFENIPFKERYLSEYSDFIEKTTGIKKDWSHIRELQKLKYLPIAIHALPEGSVVPCGVPALVIYNTHPDFYWVTNFLETYLSCTLWGPCTVATLAREYRRILDHYAKITSDIPEFVDYQAHDFSFRGMFGLESAVNAGMAHLQYFKGTDNIPALLERNIIYKDSLYIASVPATEHSVMSAGFQTHELETFKRLITEIYPTGIVSIVSDTWNLWKVVTEYLPLLKNIIMNREGKVVIRPDSGDPVKIICGSEDGISEEEKTGLIEILWDIFGGSINSKGYKQLDPHIGAIYGDSITLERAKSICEGLKNKGFSSTNVVLGIGSYSYQYNTRDTFGWAMKATYVEIGGKGYPITKNPITDSGVKKSHSGLLKVIRESNDSSYRCLQNVSWEEFHKEDNFLKLIYKNGKKLNI